MEIMKENNGEKEKMEKEWKEGNMDGWNQGGRLKRRKHGRKDGNRERMEWWKVEKCEELRGMGGSKERRKEIWGKEIVRKKKEWKEENMDDGWKDRRNEKDGERMERLRNMEGREGGNKEGMMESRKKDEWINEGSKKGRKKKRMEEVKKEERKEGWIDGSIEKIEKNWRRIEEEY